MTITGILSALLIGLIIGALARLVIPGKQKIPLWLTIVIGIIGAIIGTFLAQVVGVAVTHPASTGSRSCCRSASPPSASPLPRAPMGDAPSGNDSRLRNPRLSARRSNQAIGHCLDGSKAVPGL
jgi:uncharacterized membrane protein YeaQ/YmgE (transglycosylase-associated protein family)